ncbi:MAG: FliA/WhiG family RNA polymerase sigma factor [Deltaproteobacteria bacterium]|nr:MAG: FliA/WhiG family RNA polymerase sigma factor [Deltaproteobacteria bacterium]
MSSLNQDPSFDRQALILEYTPLVKFIAHRIAAKLPSHVELDDLINSGVLGLMDAVEKFDPDRGIQFKTFAEFRIKGAILDDLRAQDSVSRTVRQKARKLENAYSELEQKLGRPATDEEVAEELGIELDDFYKLVNQTHMTSLISLEDLVKNATQKEKANFIDALTSTGEEDPFSHFTMKEVQEITAQAIEELPEKERYVVALYYYEELTMREIGEVLEITESRVSQIHSSAIRRLRSKLSKVLAHA